MNLKKWFRVTAVLALAAFGLAACGSKSASKDDSKTIRVGIMTKSEADEARWNKIQELLDKDGIKLEFTEFTDYSQPNKALAEGEVDINAFQHYNFLNNWNKENKGDLVAIADTYIAPIRLYPGKDVKKLEDIKDGAEIAIPNDPTNESRALYLLQLAGLITLDVSGTELATVVNIKENKKNLKITELEASQTARSLESVSAAVINNTFVTEAGIDPETALYIEERDENSKQWFNILTANKDWEKSPKADAINKLIKAYHTDDVKKVIDESSKGLELPVW